VIDGSATTSTGVRALAAERAERTQAAPVNRMRKGARLPLLLKDAGDQPPRLSTRVRQSFRLCSDWRTCVGEAALGCRPDGL